MDKIIIIGTYPDQEYKIQMLEDCIQSLKPLGYHMMVVSHYPIPEKIQKEVNYVLYDSENKLINSCVPDINLENEFFHVQKKGVDGHILSVSTNIVNSLKFARAKKYDFFYYLECDNLFHQEDLIKLETLRVSMIQQGKKMIFFHSKNGEIETYETLMFGGILSFYENHIFFPTTICELEGQSVSLERFFNVKNKVHENHFYLVSTTSQEFFNKSQINKEFRKYWGGLFASNREPYLFLFIQNRFQNKDSIWFKINNSQPLEYGPGAWAYFPIYPNTGNLNVEIKCDTSVENWEFDVTNNNPIHFSQFGFLKFSN